MIIGDEKNESLAAANARVRRILDDGCEVFRVKLSSSTKIRRIEIWLLGILILPRCRALNLWNRFSQSSRSRSRILISALKILQGWAEKGKGIDLHSSRFKRWIARIPSGRERNKNKGYFFSRGNSLFRDAKVDPRIIQWIEIVDCGHSRFRSHIIKVQW